MNDNTSEELSLDEIKEKYTTLKDSYRFALFAYQHNHLTSRGRRVDEDSLKEAEKEYNEFKKLYPEVTI